MPDPPHRWSPLAPAPARLYRPVPVDPVHGPTRGQAAGPRWRRSSPGHYVPVAADRTVPEQRILEESMRLPPRGAVTGWAACRLAGANLLDGLEADGRTERPVHLTVGPGNHRRRVAGVEFLEDRLDGDPVVRRYGIPCLPLLRALFDEMRLAADLDEAVVAVDMVAAAELASVSQMERYTAARGRRPGVPQVRRALALADENSRSPNETRLRLIWVLEAGLPPPHVNRPVFTLDGRLLGYADLLDEEAGMFGEYDGAEHRRAARQTRDAAREDLCRRAGLEYFKVTGLDLADHERVVARMLATRRRARFLPPGRRLWTLTPPPGFYDRAPEDAMTLDERLAHRADLRGFAG